MKLNKFTVSLGLITTTYLWKSFGNKGVKYISDKIIDAGNYLHLDNDYTTWFKPEYIVGVSLASQIFCNINPNHSPVVKFAEKSIVGFSYYIPTVLTYELSKDLITKLDYFSSNIIDIASGIGSVLIGGIAGEFIQTNTYPTLNKVTSKIDTLATNTFILGTSVFSSLVGKVKAEEVNHAGIHDYSQPDSLILSGEIINYNSTHEYP